MIRWRRLVLFAFLAVLAVAAARDLARLGDSLPWRNMYDFAEFYCAGETLDRGENPYRYGPMRDCEHRANDTALFRDHPTLAIPAPQPPYDFPPFMALAKLDFATARTLDAIAIVLAVVLAAFALTRVGIPFDIAAIALALPAGYVELNAGQIVPFALLLLTMCGAALAARKDALAGVFAALMTIEPHLGLGVVLAALFFVPRSRPALLLTGAFLAVVGIWTVGFATLGDYVLRVIPAQAASELVFPYEYSLTYALHYFGASVAVAQTLGTLSFFFLLAGGLWIAPRIAAVMGRRELLVFLPAACAVMAGPYLHMVELCFAIPATLVFATRLRGTLRNVSAAALCALMIPWIGVWAIRKLFLISVLLCVVVLIRLQIDPAFAVAAIACITAAIYAFEFVPPNLPPPRLHPGPFASDGLVQTQWRAFTERLQTRDFRWIAIKVPTWAAMTALLAVALLRLRSPKSPPLTTNGE